MNIKPINEPGDYKTGELASSLSPGQISQVLGFGPNVDDDPDKVANSWGFEVDGVRCAIWDYKGRRWSTFGPHCVFQALFPNQHSSI